MNSGGPLALCRGPTVDPVVGAFRAMAIRGLAAGMTMEATPID